MFSNLYRLWIIHLGPSSAYETQSVDLSSWQDWDTQLARMKEASNRAPMEVACRTVSQPRYQHPAECLMEQMLNKNRQKTSRESGNIKSKVTCILKNKRVRTTLNAFWWWVAFLQDDVCCFLSAVWHAAPHCAPLDPIQHMNMGNTAGIRIFLDNLHISLWCDEHRRAVLLVVISHWAPPCNWCPACGGWLTGGRCSSSWIAGSAIHLQVREIPAREKARMILN